MTWYTQPDEDIKGIRTWHEEDWFNAGECCIHEGVVWISKMSGYAFIEPRNNQGRWVRVGKLQNENNGE